ncbi:MAG: AAA family ATPase [Gemmataceae bacterium]
MLKRLEMVGFKSFADKTMFEFGPGITAIVGPNGSGKSNVVDAVRWILGEQSAKSLRGGEMTDVIFNGSASRKSFGMAEVSITFDNSRQLLASDQAELRVTRRVYRSGEGEYLINNQHCRLKDIKDLFLGSGAGADAYCIIAQGKVDVLLQASTKERRTIFEEAAGISRFKAKKNETLRKLQRVDQNVERLRDIIEEVEKQLRSVKLQASKAQRYQEYSAGLKQLRVGLGLQEFHHLSQKLAIEEDTLGRLRHDLDTGGERVTSWEAQQAQLEQALAQLDEQMRDEEAALAEARQNINAQRMTFAHEQETLDDLAEELARLRKTIATFTKEASALEVEIREASRSLEEANEQTESQRQKVQLLEEGLEAIVARLAQLDEQLQHDKTAHLEQMRLHARLENDAVSYKAQVDNLDRELRRLQTASEQAAETLASIDVELQQLTEADQQLQERLTQSRELLGREQQERDRLRKFCDEITDTISELRQQRSGSKSRAEVLEGLERTHEGLGTGVGEMLDLIAQARENDGAEYAWLENVLGMVADFLTVRREYAPLVDVALGDWSQRFLVRDAGALMASLQQRKVPFSGRVSFLPVLEPPQTASTPDTRSRDDPSERNRPGIRSRHRNRLTEVSALGQIRMPRSPEGSPAHPGLIARVDHLVTCDHPELEDLPQQLLGRTLLVRDLNTAYTIAEHTSGFRLVTARGELLEPDGTLTVGDHHADTGILSRKSELREVREELDRLDRRIADAELDLIQAREQLAVADGQIENRQQEIQVLSEQVADLRSRLEMHRDRRQDLHEEVTVSQDEIQRVQTEVTSLRQKWEEAKEQAAVSEQEVQTLQQQIQQAEAELREREQHRQQRHQEWTTNKVTLAKLEERLSSLEAKHQQLYENLQHRHVDINENVTNLELSEEQWQASQLAMLEASSQLAHWTVVKEINERQIADQFRDREAKRAKRAKLNEQMQSVRGQWQSQQQQFHNHELQANDLRHKRDTISERLREDYEMDLAELYRQAVAYDLWNGGFDDDLSRSPHSTPSEGRDDTCNSVPEAENRPENTKVLTTTCPSETDQNTPTGEEDETEEAVPIVEDEASQGADGIPMAIPVEQGVTEDLRGSVDIEPVREEFPYRLPEDTDEANQEIEELRRKLQKLGSVNLDALQELADLETRDATLTAQYDDLMSAKRSLEEIIAKINGDSRRLFAETYETVRGHFQELFRKLFGGGMADIILEDETDILESGIEINARPPGKELRSISLMSGGEKTMTAVALLLAIFRSKPSPFCILDEVDAALDEANIGRFADVLRDFLDQSHFIIITHSKRTMSTADVIYGVTMQESGISKRVSIRLDDWPDEENGDLPDVAEAG